MINEFNIYFDTPKTFEIQNIKPLSGLVGLYFIFSTDYDIKYPFKKSKLLYIGMSEKKTNSIARRLQDHFDGSSGNLGLANYGQLDQIFFTVLNSQMLKSFWREKVELLESSFILDFVRNYGVYPICNNKRGFEANQPGHDFTMTIDWNFFEK
ncbi:MAG: hypothetical protein IH819_10755 [Bacteroidetes bacterium]|nr:hypothetical protein [Bacteroidota bacterium]